MIHNISIATDDDIVQLQFLFVQGNYYFGKLSKLARKDHCFRPYFFVKFLYADLATYLWPMSVCLYGGNQSYGNVSH